MECENNSSGRGFIRHGGLRTVTSEACKLSRLALSGKNVYAIICVYDGDVTGLFYDRDSP